MRERLGAPVQFGRQGEQRGQCVGVLLAGLRCHHRQLLGGQPGAGAERRLERVPGLLHHRVLRQLLLVADQGDGTLALRAEHPDDLPALRLARVGAGREVEGRRVAVEVLRGGQGGIGAQGALLS